LPKGPAYGEAIHPRQPHICQDQVWLRSTGQLQCPMAIYRVEDLETLTLQPDYQGHRNAHIILCEEDCGLC